MLETRALKPTSRIFNRLGCLALSLLMVSGQVHARPELVKTLAARTSSKQRISGKAAFLAWLTLTPCKGEE